VVDVLLVLEDDAEGILDHVGAELGRAESEQGARPVERLGHPGRLEEIDLAQPLGKRTDLVGEALGSLRHADGQDAELLLESWKIDPVVEAAPLERVVDLTGAVGGQDHDRNVFGPDGSQLGHRHLEVGEELEQEGFQLLVGTVHFVDQEDGSAVVGGVDGLQQWALEEELFAEEVVPGRVAVDAAAGFERPQVEHLARVVPLVDSGGGVQTLVALEANQGRVEDGRQNLGDLRLADAGLPFEEQRFLEAEGEIERRRQSAIGDVFLVA
jgi:hypothetical protein